MSQATLDAIDAIIRARRSGPEAVAAVVAGDPAKQKIATWFEKAHAEAPPLTPEQRAGIRALFRAPVPGSTGRKR